MSTQTNTWRIAEAALKIAEGRDDSARDKAARIEAIDLEEKLSCRQIEKCHSILNAEMRECCAGYDKVHSDLNEAERIVKARHEKVRSLIQEGSPRCVTDKLLEDNVALREGAMGQLSPELRATLPTAEQLVAERYEAARLAERLNTSNAISATPTAPTAEQLNTQPAVVNLLATLKEMNARLNRIESENNDCLGNHRFMPTTITDDDIDKTMLTCHGGKGVGLVLNNTLSRISSGVDRQCKELRQLLNTQRCHSFDLAKQLNAQKVSAAE